MRSRIVMELSNVTKTYFIHHEKPTMMENFLNGWNSDKFTALNNINLIIHQGEQVGIIGRNGSGKTTLLKVISGITTPTSGSTSISGKLVSLIDLEAGFHPDLTGDENIYLNAMILGMTKREIDTKKDQICDFSGLNDFIDAPMYTYSSGMILRLGFSIAAHTDPDILILDENLSVGDQNFQSKINKKLTDFKKQNKTFILVSHSLEQISARCKRVIWMDKGEIKGDGPTQKILDRYIESFK